MGGRFLESVFCWLWLMEGGWGSLVYRGVLIVLFVFLLGSRVPYVFSLDVFAGVVVFFVLSGFVSLVFSRLGRWDLFLTSLLPCGTPLWIAPAIFYIELVSFLVRPLVLVLRPIVNLAFGCFGTIISFHCVLGFHEFGVPLVFFLLVYETILLMVHWFIVHQILLFTHEG
uniref:ATP synthase F0 subunit 6 n=1 Tax=Brachydistomum sp. PakPr2 TaxID=2714095 RepID=A0A6H0YCS8_9TREM|nr:ATP synthase F0 subunit 6 [Brachydistomum sp. PakPr2]